MSLLDVVDLLVIFCAGLMIGAEFSVSAFINPTLRRLPSAPQALAMSLFASQLGFIMPCWYVGCLVLFLAETYLRRATSAFVPLLCAAGLWAGVIVFTLTVLVPINNHVAKLDANDLATDWQRDPNRWDFLHKLRIALLGVAFLVAVSSILYLR